MDAYSDCPVSWHLPQVETIMEFIWLRDAPVLRIIFWVLCAHIA